MDGRIVQRLFAIANPQESGRLLVSLCAQLGHVAELLAVVEPPVRVAILDNPLGQLGTDAGHVGQQRRAGHVHVDSDRVDARLDFTVQALAQQRLVHVVLILADADRLGIDLDQLGQRVLQPMGNADGASNRHIQVRDTRGRPVRWPNRSTLPTR